MENERVIQQLEEERDNLRREKRALEEMLYQVLNEVGEPITVFGETLRRGIVGDKMIDVFLNQEEDIWTFRLVDVE